MERADQLAAAVGVEAHDGGLEIDVDGAERGDALLCECDASDGVAGDDVA